MHLTRNSILCIIFAAFLHRRLPPEEQTAFQHLLQRVRHHAFLFRFLFPGDKHHNLPAFRRQLQGCFLIDLFYKHFQASFIRTSTVLHRLPQQRHSRRRFRYPFSIRVSMILLFIFLQAGHLSPVVAFIHAPPISVSVHSIHKTYYAPLLNLPFFQVRIRERLPCYDGRRSST